MEIQTKLFVYCIVSLAIMCVSSFLVPLERGTGCLNQPVKTNEFKSLINMLDEINAWIRAGRNYLLFWSNVCDLLDTVCYVVVYYKLLFVENCSQSIIRKCGDLILNILLY